MSLIILPELSVFKSWMSYGNPWSSRFVPFETSLLA